MKRLSFSTGLVAAAFALSAAPLLAAPFTCPTRGGDLVVHRSISWQRHLARNGRVVAHQRHPIGLAAQEAVHESRRDHVLRTG
jgi:hypothetical protein